MKKLFKCALLWLLFMLVACQGNKETKTIAKPSLESKMDSAVLLMYKLYSDCETSILENSNGKIDTIAKIVSYLCLPVKINPPEVFGDTTLITVFFEPERGYEIEDPNCDFAYSVGFIGADSQYDFVMFGDNYYTLNSAQLKNTYPDMDSIFSDNLVKVGCIHQHLKQLLDISALPGSGLQ
ncbi:MAG TPA: hypothetical protein VK168_18405 [Saprospiraceae bacterium]|nr:hypothetical protein [Saprospiraceae bacterium]